MKKSTLTVDILGALALGVGIFVAIFILALASTVFGHFDGPHAVRCNGGLVVQEWQLDKNGDGKADGVKYFVDGYPDHFAELYATNDGNVTGGRVGDKTYDSFEALKKDWPTICGAARAWLEKQNE